MSGNAIFEGEPIDIDAIVKDCEDALKEIGKSFISDFRAVTSTWEHKPTFKVFGPFMHRGDLIVEVFPTTYEDIWTWVDQGTAPHVILPKGPGYPMRFPANYEAKTELYSLWPTMGQGKHGPEVAAWKVNHPGIKARLFTTQTAYNHQQWWNTKVFLIFYRHGVPYAGGAGRSRPVTA